MTAFLNVIDAAARVVVFFARLVIIASGIVLTVITTANVIARYALSSGGLSSAQELPMLIFPWFILSGIVLAAHMGGHMAVEWVYDKLEGHSRLVAFGLAGSISTMSFLILAYEAVLVAGIAGVEKSPVLGLPNSIGYYSLAAGALLVSLVTVAAMLRVFRFGWECRTELKPEEVAL
ncbi:TRAP transporter small permease [Phyllobacterium zundukense]|uniref:TRAP transporter small permease protein n=1 Tax=Phyllobacterium zundukense TaxID=1867719 RepID=A0A2N9VYB5_9HYPH|nr:TRAP transporter small permease subunit [Phyllobacterium zundukense]ATU95072.1 C4-dicarboxylate ABC transporter permease [Phyllobacterium zundukense]PIO44483.1 C4-dicarboxylate ABC transporter permease [Phyllobacterium zundukense]